MFVHTGENSPADPEYPIDLEKLGYKVSEDRQIVSIEHGHHFTFFHTNNERANDTRKEAMHEAVRRIVADELMALGVDEIYLDGPGGAGIPAMHREGKPAGKHMKILTSKAMDLYDKKDVVVVIGDPSEDAGIWAWRHLLGDGGIDGGSAVGLVKRLIPLGLDSRDRKTQEKDTNVTTIDPKTRGYGLGRQNPRTPGLIILNPGALYWSPTEQKTMTWTSWMARPREHALGEDYAIIYKHNYNKGHTNAREHIETCLDSVLPQLLSRNAQLYVVAMSNSAEYFIDWYNKRHSANTEGTHKKVSAMAFMEPTHDPAKVNCQFAKMMLNEYGKQWVKSDKPLGELLSGDGGTKEAITCATYSGATDIDEMIWPNVMGEVLNFFKSEADKAADAR